MRKTKKIPKCLKCHSFAWWDGEYCCVAKMLIFNQLRKKGMFDDELIKAIKKEAHNCEDFDRTYNPMMLNMHIEEYISWKELHDLEKQLERHVK